MERAAILDWMLPDRWFLASVAGGGDNEWRGSSFTRREPSTVKKSKTGEQTTKGLVFICYLDGHISELFLQCHGALIQRGRRGGAMGTRGGERLTLMPPKLQ
jgi:hypothetical protein